MRCAITGAFGYSGREIARQLLERGHEVLTLTGTRPREDPFGGRVRAHPLAFEDPGRLQAALEGTEVLVNTYWVRFNHRTFTHGQAVRNSSTLFEAARRAGVRRIVHVSITNPSEHSPWEYFSGKWQVEQALIGTGVEHTILRPAVFFGERDILVNNIAWALRCFPVFGVFGDGSYRLQPIHVVDFARLAAEESGRTGKRVVQAIGPSTYTYRELVGMLADVLKLRRLIAPVPARIGYLASLLIGTLMGDVFVTWDEIEGLMAGLLAVDAPPAGQTRLDDWARSRGDTLGMQYHSELALRRS